MFDNLEDLVSYKNLRDDKKIMFKTSKKQLIEWGGMLALFIILFTTDLGTELSGMMKRGMLKTGFLNASFEDVGKTDKMVDKDFKLIDQEGKTTSFKSLAAKPTLVKFWASWCPSCIAELPSVENVYGEMKDDLNFVLISVDRDSEKLSSFLKKKGYQVPVYQLGSSYPEVFRGNSIPRSYILNSDRAVVYERSGMINLDTDAFQEFVKNLK